MLLKPLKHNPIPPIKVSPDFLLTEIASCRHPAMHHLRKVDEVVFNPQSRLKRCILAFGLIFGTEGEDRNTDLLRDLRRWEAWMKLSASFEGRVCTYGVR